MNVGRLNLSRRVVRAGLALAAAGLLLGGAAWRGLAANPQAAQAKSERPSSTVTHAVAAGRDSYADIVKVVSPAVVTIRTEGKSRVSPTDFQGDDLFRRFFG